MKRCAKYVGDRRWRVSKYWIGKDMNFVLGERLNDKMADISFKLEYPKKQGE